MFDCCSRSYVCHLAHVRLEIILSCYVPFYVRQKHNPLIFEVYNIPRRCLNCDISIGPIVFHGCAMLITIADIIAITESVVLSFRWVCLTTAKLDFPVAIFSSMEMSSFSAGNENILDSDRLYIFSLVCTVCTSTSCFKPSWPGCFAIILPMAQRAGGKLSSVNNTKSLILNTAIFSSHSGRDCSRFNHSPQHLFTICWCIL